MKQKTHKKIKTRETNRQKENTNKLWNKQKNREKRKENTTQTKTKKEKKIGICYKFAPKIEEN